MIVRISHSILETGFTLLEVIIAMAILVMTFGGVLILEGNGLKASYRAQEMNIVGMLAKNQMIETEYALEGKPFKEVKKENSGTFDPPYNTYHWKTSIKEIQIPNLLNNRIESKNLEGHGELEEIINHRISEFLSKGIREVTVTVFWKKGLGEENFSLSSYWVDLKNAPSF